MSTISFAEHATLIYGALFSIYEQREERRREEAERQRQETAGLEYLWKAAAFKMDADGLATSASPGSTGSKGLSGKKSP